MYSKRFDLVNFGTSIWYNISIQNPSFYYKLSGVDPSFPVCELHIIQAFCDENSQNPPGLDTVSDIEHNISKATAFEASYGLDGEKNMLWGLTGMGICIMLLKKTKKAMTTRLHLRK